MIYIKKILLVALIVNSCDSKGQLEMKADITNVLEEVSGVELDETSEMYWVIEDSGNKNNLYGLDSKGNILKNIDISNAKNNDWEDLTSDEFGNIYIGDFGNNNEKRKTFKIYKIDKNNLDKTSTKAEIIEFKLPKKQDSKDFEAFFIFNNFFYIFSKETKKFIVLKVPNTEGKHKAQIIADYNFKGKDNKITAADISNDGKIVVLLNHDKLWKLTNFKNDNFFSGSIDVNSFGHNSQKEGICFKSSDKVIITDERKGSEGGNIYEFNFTN